MAFSRRMLLAIASAAAFAFAAPTGAASAETLLLGAYPSNPPFEFKNAAGTFEGFEIDIATEAAKRAGLEVEISDLGFQALFAATLSRRVDVAISTITITKERLASQSFSQPYFDADMAIAARKDSPVATFADLKDKVGGGLSGSTGEKWIKDNREKHGIAEVKGYDTQQALLLDLVAGRIDFAVSDAPGMEYSFLKMTDLTVKQRISTGEQYGLMMGKDHPLLGRLNDAITAMKKDGTTAAFYKKWFGADPQPGSATVTEMPLPKA